MRRSLTGSLWALGLGFVLALARIGELRPFGIAFFYSCLELLVPVRAAAAFGVVIGAALGTPGPAALTVLACVAAGWAAALTPGRWGGGRPLGWMAAPATALARLAGSGLGLARPPLWWIETFVEAWVAGLLVQLWTPLLRRAAGASAPAAPPTPPKGADAVAGWLSLAASLALGLQPVGVGPLRAAAVLAPLTTMLASLLGGPAAAASAAAVTGGVLALGDPRWTLYGLALAIGGAGASLAERPSRPITALAVVSAVAAASVAAPTGEWVGWAVAHGLAAAGLFCLLPGRVVAALERALGSWQLVPGGRWSLGPDNGALRRQAQWLGDRAGRVLDGLSALVETFSAAYEMAAGQSPDNRGAALYVEKVHRRVCASCPSMAHCWQRHGQETFWDVLEFVDAFRSRAGGEGVAMPQGLAVRCIQPAHLTAAVRDVAEIAEAEQRALQVVQRGQARLHAELRAVVTLLGETREALTRRLVGLDAEAAGRIGRHLERLGMEPDWVWVSGQGGSREVCLALRRPCPSEGRCAEMARRAAEEVESVAYAVRALACRAGRSPEASWGCELSLTPRPRLAAEVAFAGRARNGQEVSGDRFVRTELSEALVAVILSDGMGTGPEASRESEAAVRLAESALLAGADGAAAIRCANAALLARAPDERFATLDVAVLDLAAGKLELAKAGAYPSFLWQAGRLERLEGDALPAGIVHGVEVELLRRPLFDGDLLVMVTDGAAQMGQQGEQRIQEAIRAFVDEAAPSGARALAERILLRLEALAGGQWPDDVTVAVVRVRELDGGNGVAYSEVGLVRPARVQAASKQRQRRGLGAHT